MTLYEEAEALVRSGDPERVEEGIAWLRERAEASPDDAEAWYRYGSALDYSGREEIAIGAYERVFALGLEQLDPVLRPRLYVQAGSTLRNLGRLVEARSLLEQGRSDFPANRAIVAFLALVEVSASNERRAIDLLFEVILADGTGDDSIATFARAAVLCRGIKGVMTGPRGCLAPGQAACNPRRDSDARRRPDRVNEHVERVRVTAGHERLVPLIGDAVQHGQAEREQDALTMSRCKRAERPPGEGGEHGIHGEVPEDRDQVDVEPWWIGNGLPCRQQEDDTHPGDGGDEAPRARARVIGCGWGTRCAHHLSGNKTTRGRDPAGRIAYASWHRHPVDRGSGCGRLAFELGQDRGRGQPHALGGRPEFGDFRWAHPQRVGQPPRDVRARSRFAKLDL